MTNPLEAAHERVQARKQAAGFAPIADFDAPLKVGAEGAGVLAGTDLTVEHIDQAAGIITSILANSAAERDLPFPWLLKMVYAEGLLTGIEHGRTLDR